MSTISLVIIVATISFVIFLLSCVKGRERKKVFSELLEQDFKIVDSNSYILKSNRFGSIIRQDFLTSEINSANIKKGVIKYNVEETILFCECCLADSGKKSKQTNCLAILHLFNTPIDRCVKFRKKDSNRKKSCTYMRDLGHILDMGGSYSVSSDSDIDMSIFSEKFQKVLLDLKNKFPDEGVLIINRKGWLMLNASKGNREMRNLFFNFDQRILNSFT
ncbi:MAG: hypothetical protein GY858_09990 [Candidatus Omnitrophica bacterium]|nr:hypothetical protein [Candidatus Omnitrophota bacterium]